MYLVGHSRFGTSGEIGSSRLRRITRRMPRVFTTAVNHHGHRRHRHIPIALDRLILFDFNELPNAKFSTSLLRYNCYTKCMRFRYDTQKSTLLRKKRGVGFEEVQELFYSPYFLDRILDEPEQWVAIGWVNAHLYSVIYEEREDDEGIYYHLVTLWKSTKAERLKYEKNS